ncbi:MAG TPA: DinB family protein [Actinomycetota bacterium]|nr:DinB family protein [Actinomycetota bacterium]
MLAALAVIGRTPALIRGLFSSLPEQVLKGDSPGRWGPREVLEHLVDVEGIAFRERIRRILHEDRPLIRSIDPPARLQEGGYARRSLEELLAELEGMRAEDVAWLRAVDPADYRREGEHDAAGTIQAGQLIHYWAVHDLVHLRQMLSALQDVFMPHVGGMDKFLEEV